MECPCIKACLWMLECNLWHWIWPTFVWILGIEPMSLGFEVSIFYYSILFHWPIGANFLCCFSVFLRYPSFFFSAPLLSLPPSFLFVFFFFSPLSVPPSLSSYTCECADVHTLAHVYGGQSTTLHVFLYFFISYCLEVNSHLSWTPGACSQSGFFLSAGNWLRFSLMLAK